MDSETLLQINQSVSSSQFHIYSQLWVQTSNTEQLKFPLNERVLFIHKALDFWKPEIRILTNILTDS